MKKNLKFITVLLLSTSMLTFSVYAAPTTSQSSKVPNETVENTMNVNSSDVLIANKMIENLNLINAIKVNGIISTEVYDNPSTGYTWIFEVTGDPGVLTYTFLDKPVSTIQTDDKASEKPLICGEGTNKILTIKGIKSGKAKLKMSLVRPWEKNIEPAKVMEFEVLVK